MRLRPSSPFVKPGDETKRPWRSLIVAIVVPLWLGAGSATGVEPLSREKLQSLLKSGVDADVIAALIRKDCVSFQLDADTVLELSQQVPPGILKAAIECRGASSVRAVETTKPAHVTVTCNGCAENMGAQVMSYSSSAGCKVFLDYTGSVKILRRKWGLVAPSGFLKDDWLKEFPSPPLAQLKLFREEGSGMFRQIEAVPGAFDVPAGEHTLSFYCHQYWHRNDVRYHFEAGRSYKLVLTDGGELSGTSINGIAPE